MHPLEEAGRSSRNIDPCALVIFGASGDLTARRLLPALYNLSRDGMLPTHFGCIGFARREKTDEQFRKEAKESVATFSRMKNIDETLWTHFEKSLSYCRSEFDSDEGYQKLKAELDRLDKQGGTRGNRLYYLSVQPKYFPVIVQKLKQHGLLYDEHKSTPWSRVIIEKPFGRDSQSAELLQQSLSLSLDETQTYRIDHWLGKETVQNLLVFRFANSIFESIWNYKHIDHIQISVAEEIGIGTRGAFWEEEGMMRDIVQNHMMQLLSLVAMEPPVNLSADSIRDEKVKVLASVRPLLESEMESSVIRGQYGSGFINGEPVLGYRQEKNVDPRSCIETFVAMRLFIDNWRWAGVPFYLRAGKRLPKRATEIAVVFKDAPGVLFQSQGKKTDPNVLVMRIQPDEGISLKINCKVPGPSSPIRPVKMDFQYGSYFGQGAPEAYERLIWDCILGDGTLFARSDEVTHSWNIVTPILNHWAREKPHTFPNYAAGTWGPKEASLLLAANRAWRIL
jgi:glucose-6-phosphate 1-dehydrogenase